MVMYISTAIRAEIQVRVPVRYTFIEVKKFAIVVTESTSSTTSATAFAPRHDTWCGAPKNWDELAPGRAPPSCGGPAGVG